MIIGPAGTGGDVFSGMGEIYSKGLGAVEIEFTHGVRMSNGTAKKVRENNPGLVLSVHAPYYVNLAAKEAEKQEASVSRILQTCERAHLMGARHVVFHPGFYMGREPGPVYNIIRDRIIEIMAIMKKNSWKCVLAPETTGKQSQFGSLSELLRLKKDTGCHFCIDFAHLRARKQGQVDYQEVLAQVTGMALHCHYSGIEYGDKGEKRHLLIDEDDFQKLAMAAKSRDITVICESPEPLGDALKMKGVLESL